MKLLSRAFHAARYFAVGLRGPRKSARVLIVENGKLLVFLRKRFSRVTGEWIEYYSIPGGGIDKGEQAEHAAIRELREEMGVAIALDGLVAHRIGKSFEHFVYHGHIDSGRPRLMADSEEASYMSEKNQYIVMWVDVASLTVENLRYYSDYLKLIQRLSAGEVPQEVLRIDVR